MQMNARSLRKHPAAINRLTHQQHISDSSNTKTPRATATATTGVLVYSEQGTVYSVQCTHPMLKRISIYKPRFIGYSPLCGCSSNSNSYNSNTSGYGHVSHFP